MRRLSLALLPFLSAFALVFGLYYLYAAVRLIQMGRAMQAALVGLFGIVGVVLAVGIWVARKRVRALTSESPGNAPRA
ncbi:MAG TPA: hypothetical protein VFZ21_05840 [Gemmatimonadaceae bacterium]|jgi:hypothetical protein|nr:hypothetical protein [Gemmatimonadaceae bacterium]